MVEELELDGMDGWNEFVIWAPEPIVTSVE